MSMHDDMAATGFAALLASQGQTITYTPKGGSPVSVSAIVGPIRDAPSFNERGTHRERTAEVKITNDATLGITSSARGDLITLADGKTLKVDQPQERPSSFVLECQLVSDTELSSEGYRAK